MNPAPAFSRDVGRAQLGGMSMPFLDIELDEPVARLCESDYRYATSTLALTSNSVRPLMLLDPLQKCIPAAVRKD